MDENNSCDIIYLNRFIWNAEKAEINRKKHHVSFELAVQVFNDPFLLMELDSQNSNPEEERFNCIGSINGILYLFVSMTERNNLTRIISARRAESLEVKKYESRIKSL